MAYSLEEMEAYLSEIYSVAAKDLEKTARQYLKDFERLQKQNQKKVDDGKWTQEKYDTWRKNKLLYGEHWPRIIQKVQREMLKVNQTALDYVNGKVPQIFAHTYNEVANKIPKSPVSGYSFELVNSETVNKLVKEEGIMLPPKKNLDKQKDKLWNAKQLNAQILQGVLTGESIPKLAERVKVVVGNNEVAAVRTARTMCTAAENSGRQSAYNKAEADGIKLNKTWLSAYMQANTRDTHRELNEQTVRSNEMFLTFKGNELEFPGDWRAPGYEVYNCRCTMVTSVIGFDKDKLKESVERQKKEREEAQRAEQESNSNQNIEIETQTIQEEVSRAEMFSRIETALEDANIDWSNAPYGFKSSLYESLENCPDYLLPVIESGLLNVDNVSFVENGKSFYTFGTGNIVIAINGSSNEYITQVFWHEFGHYVDDAAISKSGYGYIQIFESSRLGYDDSGNIIRIVDKEEHELHRLKSLLSSYDIYGNKYQNAVANDANSMLSKIGLSGKYVVVPSSDEYGNQVILKNGEFYDTVNAGHESVDELHKAFSKQMNIVTGRTEYDKFMRTHGEPQEPIRANYFSTTISNGEAKVNEKYNGAIAAYNRDYAEYREKYDKFINSPEYESLKSQKFELLDKVESKEEKITHVSDILDGGVYGMFNAIIGTGGHTPQYYVEGDMGIDESIANVFMSEVLQDKEILEMNKEMNPEVYELIKGVLMNERNFK